MQIALSGKGISISRIVAWVIGLVVVSPIVVDFFGSIVVPEPSRPEVGVVVRTVHLFQDSAFVVDVQYGDKQFSYYTDDSLSGITWERAKALLPGYVLNCKPTMRMGWITGWRYMEAYPIDCK